MGRQWIVCALCVAVVILTAAHSADASSSVVTSVDDGPTLKYFCGALPPIEQNNAQSLMTNTTIASDGTYTITVSVPTNMPSTCVQQGTYVYDAASKKYTFTSLTPVVNPPVMYCANYVSNISFPYAIVFGSVLTGEKMTLYGNYQGRVFTIPSDKNFCFGRVPSGKYCGSALDVPANIITSLPYNFQLNILAPIDPCTVSGFYVLNEAFGNLVYEVGSSNCTQYLVFNNITYSANPPALAVVGSAYGIGFSATLAQSQC